MLKSNVENVGGYVDSRGEWRPEKPISFAPLFVWPPKLKKFLVWLVNYLFTWNLIYLGIVLLCYNYLQPPLDDMKSFGFSWIFYLFVRNMALVWIVYGGWHLYLYKFKMRGNKAKYCPRWQSTDGATFLWNNQVYDNVFWACASAVPIWTAFEVVSFWLYANDKIPYLDFKENPVWFILWFLLIPLWRELHFYLIHRLIHWKPLYDKIHYLHHYNINPGPWSGLAMHPVEHVLYFSVVIIHWIVPSHPLHFLFNSQHTALTPAPSHTGFEGKVVRFLPFGSYFHYLHHRLFECNYGESTVPLDKWFGIFEDGAQTQTEKREAETIYNKLRVEKIVEEGPEVKSFYFTRLDNQELKRNLAGQHLTFKVPFYNNELHTQSDSNGYELKYSIRSYTISNISENGMYRISVKREEKGKVSAALHKSLKLGDVLEAKGPKGTFVHKLQKRKLSVFIAAGIGITPILPMLRSLEGTREDVYLFIAARDEKLMVFKKELKEICNKNANLIVKVFLSRRAESVSKKFDQNWQVYRRRLTLDDLKNILPDNRDFNFFICGPDKMNEEFKQEIEKWKGSKTIVNQEKFGVVNTSDKSNSPNNILVRFKKSNKTISWNNEFVNVLEFAESNGISLEAGCMFGECGACSTKVIKGDVEYNFNTAAKPSKGNCLPCSCRPGSDLELDA